MDTNITKARSLLEGRLKELADERSRVEGALSSLGHKAKSSKSRRPKSRAKAPAKRTQSKTNRSDQFVKIVTGNPGITAGEAAKKMRVKPNYLYRVAAKAVEAKRVTRDGKGYHVAS